MSDLSVKAHVQASMCGRNSLFLKQSELQERFDAIVTDGGYEPRYNIAPGSQVEVITNDEPDTITRYHWGLIPFWEDQPQEGIINARSETVGEKRVFASSWNSRPCLVLSSGFYEWQSRGGGGKQPYRIHRENDRAFAFAGIWDVWEGEDNNIPCVTVLTTEPNDVMEPIHDRMPVILPRDAESSWLEGDEQTRKELCKPYPNEDLVAYEIDRRVNDPSNDDPRVIEPLDHEQSGLGSFT